MDSERDFFKWTKDRGKHLTTMSLDKHWRFVKNVVWWFVHKKQTNGVCSHNTFSDMNCHGKSIYCTTGLMQNKNIAWNVWTSALHFLYKEPLSSSPLSPIQNYPMEQVEFSISIPESAIHFNYGFWKETEFQRLKMGSHLSRQGLGEASACLSSDTEKRSKRCVQWKPPQEICIYFSW